MKKLVSVLLSCLMIFSLFGFKSIYAEDGDDFDFNPKPMDWPGRPNGNGDGSEEWMTLGYGETNGKWTLVYSKDGETQDLVITDSIANQLSGAIIGIVTSVLVLNPVIGVAVGVGSTAAGIKDTIEGRYDGAYYRIKVYVSGRCMKILIDTYKDYEHNKHMKTYEKYIKW